MDLKEEEILGAAVGEHWYYAAKLRAMRRLLAGAPLRRFVDIGAGSGFFARRLLAGAGVETAQCIDINYPAERDEVSDGKPITFARAARDLPRQDTFLLIDVLEHVDDDTGLLRGFVASAPAGATFLLSVPAFRFLWSRHDVFLEHRRRYRLAELEAVAQAAGLEVIRGRYFFGLLFPLVALVRLLRPAGRDAPAQSDLKPASPFVNSVLRLVCRIEEVTLLPFNRLLGVTAFCLARKPGVFSDTTESGSAPRIG